MSNASDFVMEDGILTKYTGPGGIVRIPEGVAEIGNAAFERCVDVTEVILPHSVSVIGIAAFSGCSKLAKIEIPDSVTRISDRAFGSCGSLTQIALPKNMISIGAGVFRYCSKLAKMVIPEGVIEIGREAFFQCRSLTEVVFPESLARIGAAAFSGCVQLTDITLPKTVKWIGSVAFYDCAKLTNVVIPGSMVTAGSEIFCGISDRARILAPGIPITCYETADEKRAAAYGFLSQPELYQDAEIADAYKKYVIAQRKRLLPYVFQQDLAQALAVFAQNKKITASNYEGEYLEPAEKANAVNCKAYLLNWRNGNITTKDLQKKEQRELTKDPFNVADMKKLWSYEKREDGSLIITSYKGTETEVHVPERIGKAVVTALDDNVFAPETKTWTKKPPKQIAALQAIQSVTIPEGVTSIGSMAFYECKSLEKVEIPESVTSIGRHAFSKCEKLGGGNGLVVIRDVVYGYYSFGSCVTIPEGVTRIEDGAFSGRSSLTRVAFPGSVTDIGRRAFEGCSRLADAVIPSSVTSIGGMAFYKCDKLADENGFVVVHGVLYSYCGPGGNVKIPEGVTEIGEEAFSRRRKLTGVEIPEGVTKIGYNAFGGCGSLTDVVIPASVTDINYLSFSNPDRVKIHAPKGSCAESYAKARHISFVAI